MAIKKPREIKFREMITHNGTTVLAGRDAVQNEKLVKLYKGKNNVIMHTANPGSPFCVIVDKPKRGDKKEAAMLCAQRSQTWRDDKKDVLIHSFTGKDVYKRKDMSVGTFGIKKFKKVRIKKTDVEGWLQ